MAALATCGLEQVETISRTIMKRPHLLASSDPDPKARRFFLTNKFVLSMASSLISRSRSSRLDRNSSVTGELSKSCHNLLCAAQHEYTFQDDRQSIFAAKA